MIIPDTLPVWVRRYFWRGKEWWQRDRKKGKDGEWKIMDRMMSVVVIVGGVWGKFLAGRSDQPAGHCWPMVSGGWSVLTSRPLAAPIRSRNVEALDQWERGMLATTDHCWPMAGWGIWWRMGEPTPSRGLMLCFRLPGILTLWIQ